MYVYCTREVLEEGAQYDLKVLIERLEQGDRTLLSQLFDVRYPYWKRNLRGNIRLVGELRHLGEESVLVLFGLWPRGSHEYQEFLDRREDRDYQEWVRNRAPDGQLQDWLAERQRKNLQKENLQNRLPPLPDELYEWTRFLNAPNLQERLVLESGEWVRQVQALSHEQRRQVYRAVAEFVGNETGELYCQLPRFYSEAEVKCWQEGSLHLALSLVQVCEREGVFFPFLIGVYDHNPEQKERFELGSRTCLFGMRARQPDILQHPQPLEVWKRYARRAYPDYIVMDETIWLEMQESTEGNLALSMEEEEILQSTSMPLLINGRAGSGKSLMLYYRFADYCSHYLKTSRQGTSPYHPLFLTYSASLVQQARDRVSAILRISHRYREEGYSFSAEEIRQCRAFFRTFQDYLLSCLPPERQERYQPDQYVNFYRFQSWYRRRHDVDLELAWHTIRTLIKGYEASDYLDPDGYRELPEADRSVDERSFEWIYKGIWPNYQERIADEGYWDDQDLARDVLQNGTLNPIHPVIFCDEVQDFTQLELNIIFCLSPWGKYKLDWAVERLPYAFAGDPLQTINPTGFRWAALKKYLYEHIRAYLSPAHPFRIEDPQELKNNYRSNPQITRFSNVVNLWRRVLSGNREIYPQQPWRPQEQGMPVQQFVLDGQEKNLIESELRNILSDLTGTVCVLPCSTGEELNYVAQDPELQKVFAEELEQNLKPPLLQTVTTVKGMEFKKVILYKFGDYYRQKFDRNLKHCIWRGSGELALQYFLNQLYVGITRPIEALAIVDTSAGWQKFWNPSLELNFWLDHPSLEEDWSKWKTDPPLLSCPVKGMNIQYWTNTSLKDLLESALELLERGIEGGNLSLLEDVQTLAQKADNSQLEQECRAWILKFRKDYLSAGRQFLSLEKSALPNQDPIREAWECFWRARAWSELQQHTATHFAGHLGIPDYSPLVDLMVVTQKTSAKSMERFRQLVRVRDWLSAEVSPKNNDSVPLTRTDPTWRACVEKFLAELQEVLDNLPTFCPQAEARSRLLQETLAALGGHLAFLGQRQPFADRYYQILGTCHFQQGQFEEAVGIWDQGGQTEHSRYYRAKIQLEPLPGKVRWLAKDRQDSVVLGLWQEAGRSLTGEWAEYIGDVITSLERLQEWPLLLRVLIQRREWEKLWKTVQAHPQAWQRGHDYELVACMARDLQTNWEELRRKSSGLRDFLQEVVTSVRVEQAWWLQPLEVGLAHERLGNYRDTLRFYERFAEGRTGKLTRQQRSQIRQRWLVTHQRYQEFLQAEGRPTDLLAGEFSRAQARWEEQLPQAEPELDKRDPWAYDFLEYPSPVQSWLLQQAQTDAQRRLRAEIAQALEQLDERELQQVHSLIRRFPRTDPST